MASGFGTEDIAIDSNKVNTVRTMTDKIERLFTGVRISFDITSNTDQKQWIVISGPHQFRQNAKEYITSLSNPEVKRTLVTKGEKLDTTALESIERETGAVITVHGAHKLEISGSAYPFVTALSRLETMYKSLTEETEESTEKLKQTTLEDKQGPHGRQGQVEQSVEIRIANIPMPCTKEEMAALFAGHKYDVKRINFKKNRKKKKNRFAAFIKLGSVEEAERAIKQFNGMKWKGQTLQLRQSCRMGKTKVVVEEDDWLTSPKEKFKGAIGVTGVRKPAFLPESDDDLDWSDMEDTRGDDVDSPKHSQKSDGRQQTKGKDSSKSMKQNSPGTFAKQTPSPTSKQAGVTKTKGNQSANKTGGNTAVTSTNKGKAAPVKQNAPGQKNSTVTAKSSPAKSSSAGCLSGSAPSGSRSREATCMGYALSRSEIMVDGPEEYIDPDSVDEEELFASGEPVIVLPEDGEDGKAFTASLMDSSYKCEETSLAAACKQAVLSGYSQEDVEKALGFLDYSDRDITQDELVATIIAVQGAGTEEEDRSDGESRSGSSSPSLLKPGSKGTPSKTKSPARDRGSADSGRASSSSDVRGGSSNADASVIMIDDEDSVLHDTSVGGNDSVIIVGEDHPSPKAANKKSGPAGKAGVSSVRNNKVWMEPAKGRNPPPPLGHPPSKSFAGQNKPSTVTARADNFTSVVHGFRGPACGQPSEPMNNRTEQSAPLRSLQPGNDLAASGGCKRKSYSDDEEQTCVMKPVASTEGHRQGASGGFPGGGGTVGGYIAGMGQGPHPAFGRQQAGGELFHIVVDGSNVAVCHGDQGQGAVFSCRGIEICAEYFLRRGHQVTVWVPLWRKYRRQQPGYPIRDQDVLEKLERRGIVKFTPARKLPNGQLIASHEDKWVLDLAVQIDGVVVSNDQFREFAAQGPGYEHILMKRLLPFQFVNDIFMPTPDPLGRNGPLLNDFLRRGWEAHYEQRNNGPPQAAFDQQPPVHPSTQQQRPPFQPAPARPPFRHPPPHPQLARPPMSFPTRPPLYRHPAWPQRGTSPARPPPQSAWQRPLTQKAIRGDSAHQKGPSVQAAPERHPEVTAQLLNSLKEMFPEEEQEEKIQAVLTNHASETDLNRLTNYCYSALFL